MQRFYNIKNIIHIVVCLIEILIKKERGCIKLEVKDFLDIMIINLFVFGK